MDHVNYSIVQSLKEFLHFIRVFMNNFIQDTLQSKNRNDRFLEYQKIMRKNKITTLEEGKRQNNKLSDRWFYWNL